jgi:hypothetical protein
MIHDAEYTEDLDFFSVPRTTTRIATLNRLRLNRCLLHDAPLIIVTGISLAAKVRAMKQYKQNIKQMKYFSHLFLEPFGRK